MPAEKFNMDKIEKKWEHFGEKNPYFAVLTFDKYQNENLNDEILEEFFKSGEHHVERIWREIENNFENDFHPKKSLDFGCGVGRLTIPIAKRSEKVVGVDISSNMLDEARKNAEKMGFDNLEFIKGDDTLSKVSGDFDFIHSFIVFQHINPTIGEVIFKKMVKLLSVGGIGVLHFAYTNNKSTLAQKVRFKLYRDISLTYKIRNIVLGKEDEELIPMYNYDLNRIMSVLQKNDCHQCTVKFSDHGVEGVVLFFKKNKENLY